MSAIGYVMQDRAGVYVWTSEWSGHLTRFLKKRMRTIADAAIRFAETVRTAVKSEKENSVSVRKEEVNRQAERVLTEYGNSILRLAYTYLHNYSDAEEVVQDTLIQFLRTAPQLMGTEENSGDYNQYEKLDTVSAGDCQVELRGSEDGYVLAVWTDGAYAYSLSFSQAQPKDVWMRLLEENQWN